MKIEQPFHTFRVVHHHSRFSYFSAQWFDLDSLGVKVVFKRSMQHTHPVNLHPQFLFFKHGSVRDPEKKSGQKYVMQKAGCKKQGHYYSKREEGS